MEQFYNSDVMRAYFRTAEIVNETWGPDSSRSGTCAACWHPARASSIWDVVPRTSAGTGPIAG